MRKQISILLAAAGLTMGLAACTSSGSSDSNGSTNAAASAEATNSGAGLDLIFTNQPAPIFATSAYRQQLIEIEAVEALGSPTTAFFFPPGWNGNSHPFKTCPAEGLPIPNTTQLDNPDEIVEDPYGGGYQENNGGQVEPRADPNGVYTPTSSSGTYVACLSSSGGLDAAYWEGDMYAQTGDAAWDNSTGTIQDIGPSQLPACVIEKAVKGNAQKIPAGTSYYHCSEAPKAAAYTPWAVPTGTPDGKVVLTDYNSSATLVLSCTMHDGTIERNGKVQKTAGIVSTCNYPGNLSLTFAPWGIVSAGK